MTIYRANASGIQAPMRGVSRQRYTCFLSATPTLNSEAFPQHKCPQLPVVLIHQVEQDLRFPSVCELPPREEQGSTFHCSITERQIPEIM